MPPSKTSLSPAAKQTLILNHLRCSRTCHTLKDLEKTLPSIASINGMQVKEYIQALVDDNKIRMEKIGSVNWYWSFPSEGKREREKVKENLEREVEKGRRSVADLKREVQNRSKSAEEEEEEEDRNDDDPEQRAALAQRQGELAAEVEKLKAEEQTLSSAGAAAIETKKRDVQMWRAETSMWTDDIYILEQYLTKLAGGDREAVDGLKRECYGDEYVEGEGLRDLGI